jgi:hypothetical protein
MKKRIMIIFGIFVLAAVMIAGCAPSKLTMRRESVDWQQQRVMVERSLERFDEGLFYVYEWRPGITAAVVADLRDTDRTIKPGPGWRKLNSRQELEEAYKGGSAAKTRTGMKLYRIEGADGELWGYFFAPYNILPYSVIDDKTIELGRIPEPKAPGP